MLNLSEEQKEFLKDVANRPPLREKAMKLFPEAFDKPEREGLNVRIECNKKEGLPIHMSEISLALNTFFETRDFSVKEIGAGWSDEEVKDFLNHCFNIAWSSNSTFQDKLKHFRKEKNK